MAFRDVKGRFSTKRKRKTGKSQPVSHLIDQDFVGHNVGCNVEVETRDEKWTVGRRLVEFDVLLTNLNACEQCFLGPIPLTSYNIIGELQKGLGGYLYVKCQLCGHVNKASYGKTHHVNDRGMPCFVVSTAMIDSLGGPKRVNNFLTALNLKPVSNKNLKRMEERAGDVVELVAKESAQNAAKEAYASEMLVGSSR